MVKKIPKVSRIYELPVVHKKRNAVKKYKKLEEIKDYLPVIMSKPNNKYEKEHENLSKLIYSKLYFLNKGSYKNYKKAKIFYAEYAAKNYEAVKTLPKEKIPSISIWGLSPLLPFYLIRYARIQITDLFRKKTPAEKELARLAKEYKAQKV